MVYCTKILRPTLLLKYAHNLAKVATILFRSAQGQISDWEVFKKWLQYFLMKERKYDKKSATPQTEIVFKQFHHRFTLFQLFISVHGFD